MGTEGARFIVLLPVSREAFTEEETDSMPVETIGDTAFAQPVEKPQTSPIGEIAPKKPVVCCLVEDEQRRYGIIGISPWKMTMKSLKRQTV